MAEQEQLIKSRKFYLRLLVIGLFSFALLHSINPFFFRFFFWISFGMGALTLYYHIALKIAERGTQAQFRPQGQRARWTSPESPPTPANPQAQVKRAVGIVIVVVFFIFFLLLVIGILAGDDETAEVAITDTAVFDEAHALYESQDYRGAIDVLWNDVTSGTANNQSVLLMGDAYYELKQLDSAYIWYAEGYSRGERSAFLCHALGYMVDEKGNSQEAIQYYKEAVELDSTKADVFARLAELDPNNATYYKMKESRAKGN